jgi:superfamily II DNA or RNA helicase
MPRILLAKHITPEDWQLEATGAWLDSVHPTRGRMHGILDVYTGAGKTIAAMCCIAAATKINPHLKVAVPVPATELARQWIDDLLACTNLPRERIGLVGDGENASFETHDVIVYVLASARRRTRRSALCRLARDVRNHQVMLVSDECHKAGARETRTIFQAATVCRLGLSATTERSDVEACDEHGNLLPVEKQPHGKELGPVCYRLTFRQGRKLGMLPRYEIHHHGIELDEDEDGRYQSLNKAIRDACRDLRWVGGDPARYMRYLHGRGKVSEQQMLAAQALQELYFARKQFLYSCSERRRVAARVVKNAMNGDQRPNGVLMFHERIDGQCVDGIRMDGGAEALHADLCHEALLGTLATDPSRIGIHHSRLDRAARRAALHGLRNGDLDVLVAVKALQEGIDIPDVEMAVTVASTASVRQRIQTMGRILRAARNSAGARIDPVLGPLKTIHLIYVVNTVDERIYHERDWELEMGAEQTRWWRWPLGSERPVPGVPVSQGDAPMAEEEVAVCVPAGHPPLLEREPMPEHRPLLVPSPIPLADPWYDIVGDAFGAVIRGDAGRVRAYRSRFGRGRSRHALSWMDALASGAGGNSRADLIRMTYPEIMVEAVAAWRGGDFQRVAGAREVLHERATRGSTSKARRLSGLADALASLGSSLAMAA